VGFRDRTNAKIFGTGEDSVGYQIQVERNFRAAITGYARIIVESGKVRRVGSFVWG